MECSRLDDLGIVHGLGVCVSLDGEALCVTGRGQCLEEACMPLFSMDTPHRIVPISGVANQKRCLVD